MTREARVVGETLARLVGSELTRTSARSPMLRLVGFEREEIEVALGRMESDDAIQERELTLKVATHSAWEGCPERWFLAEHETQARFRNRSPRGLVLFDVEDQPDAQSLRHFHGLQDGTILETGENDEAAQRRRLVLDLSWLDCSEQTDRPVPDELHELLEKIFHACEQEWGEISLRTWVAFAVEACTRVAEVGRAVSRREAHEVVENSLPMLLLFPDPGLFARTGGQDTKRLTRNARMSGMSSPSGKDLDEEEIERRIETTEFRDEDGGLFSDPEQESYREACVAVLRTRRVETFREVPLSIWEQIFAKDAEEKTGLGTRIHQLLSAEHANRVVEYRDLEVQTGLDDQQTEAARTLLDAEPIEEGSVALADLLPDRLRKAVEKLANPRAPSVPDPLAAILKELYSTLPEEENSEIERVRIVVDLPDPQHGKHSLCLFRFLYGNTVRSIVQSSAESVGIAVTADEILIKGDVDFVAQYRRDHPSDDQDDGLEDDDQRESGEAWSELRFQLVSEPDRRVLCRFGWNPTDKNGPAGITAFARLILDEAESQRFVGAWEDLESWCERARDLSEPLSGDRPIGAKSGLTERWQELRHETVANWRDEGLSSESIGEYVSQWQQILDDVTQQCVPTNERHDELEAFLDMETLSIGSRRHVMLATHPLRLRWVQAHLHYLQKNILEVLQGDFRLNPEVDELFFGRLAEYSPHKQPPMFSPGHQSLYIATREFGWHEEYRAIVEEDRPSEGWVSSIDSESVTAMVRVAHRYLEAHPHKIDGLSILFISRDGEAAHVEKLVRDIRKGEYRDLIVTVHVVAPLLSHEEIARRLEDLDTDERSTRDLLPRVRTVLHSDNVLDHQEARADLELEDQVDLVLVPNLFGIRTSVQERTQGSRSGEFHPLLDDTTHESGGCEGGGRKNVSRDFLPLGGDTLLEGWSSLQVWRKVWNRIGPGSQDDVDYFSLQVLFTHSLDLFGRLHDWGHWVVTLDPYVGREQIEASEKRPDVITVQPKVGKNGRYTLVVSSSTGRDFVVERLRHRLEADLNVAEGEGARQIAERLYDCGRDFAPGVILRALGLGRTVHEILGLVAARSAIDERYPRRENDLFEAWLSLDELTHWFGGAHRDRADMLRVLGLKKDGRLALRFLVLEAKFREKEDRGKGERQISRTIDVLRPAFETDGTRFADAPMWRRELVEAIQQSASRSRTGSRFTGLWEKTAGNQEGYGLSPALRDEIVEGKYEFEEMEGLLCTVGAKDESLEESEERSPDKGHRWLRIGAAGFRRLVLDSNTEPGPTIEAGLDSLEVDESDRAVGTPHEHEHAPAPVSSPGEPAEDVPERFVQPSESAEQPAGESHGLGFELLESRYQDVLNLFSQFRIHVSRPDGYQPVEGPAFYEVRVTPERGTRSDRVLGQTSELKLALRLPEHLEIRGFLDRGSVVFQVPKEDDERYFVNAASLWEKTGYPSDAETTLRVPIGEDARGEAVWLDFSSSESPHLLIGGTTGSGKSVALEAILAGLCRAHAPQSLRLLLVDPKGTELTDFENTPHLEGQIGIYAEDAIVVLEHQVEEMRRRYTLFKSRRKRNLPDYNAEVDAAQKLPWHLIVLDEYADLTSDKEDRKRIEDLLQRLAQKARAAGIHLIVATQKPSAEILSTSIRSNLPAQLALRVKTSQDSRIVMDETGAETLAGKGDAFFKTGAGIVRVQTARVVP